MTTQSPSTGQVIRELLQFDKTERPLHVVLFNRDKDGNVISSIKYPIAATISHRETETLLYIEQSQGVQQ